jgi:uncharacterized protein
MTALAHTLARELAIRPQQVEATLKLIDEGATIPFIARYRKEVTGALDDTQLRTLAQRAEYLKELDSRKHAILSSIEQQGKLTESLKQQIQNADTKVGLEDLYLPYKPKRRTKAQVAREAGLEPLADALLKAQGEPNTLAANYLNQDADINNAADALAGAEQILIERFSESAPLLEQLRGNLWREGQIQVSVLRGKAQEHSKFRDYYEHNEPVGKMPSHRALAVFRGIKAGELKCTIQPLDEGADAIRQIQKQFGLPSGHSPAARFLQESAQHAWQDKIQKQIESDLLKNVKEAADAEAIRVFGLNLKDLLLAAPAGQKVTLGLDPGLRTGVKAAIVDTTGKLLHHDTLFPHAPRNQWDQSIHQLAKWAKQFNVSLISIGNGTASRETEQLVKAMLKHHPELNCQSIVVSEAGASVYSASELAALEFPDLDVTFRGAVSIARRLQDPLAELVKIEPKAIGVGQYQHDVDQKALGETLNAVVEDCVNHVGVDLNTASTELLTQIAGLNKTTAQNIVAFRDENGVFNERKQLLKVPRLGAKAFEQCAGFLRIRGGKQPLDNSAVHPEAYALVEQMAKSLGLKSNQLIANSDALGRLTPGAFIKEGFGEYTVRDVLTELEKPGRDPRPEFKTAQFEEGVETLKDLQVGMKLEGVVTNVTNFGAFVDIGVHQDGLVHISQLSDQFVKDPHAVVSTGDIVKVTVTEVDEARKRIALSMKQGASDSPRTTNRAAKPERPKKPAPQGGSLADSLRSAGFKIK